MFDFYQDYEDSSYQLYLPEGAAVADKEAVKAGESVGA